MAEIFSSEAVVSYFSGEDSEGIGEVMFDGSGDELGMEDEETHDSEPEYEPFEPFDGGIYIRKKAQKIQIKNNFYSRC